MAFAAAAAVAAASLGGSGPLPVVAAAGRPPLLAPTAASVVLYDPASGQVLYGRDDERQLMPASTTKIMTALVALEHLHDLGQRVRITAAEAYVGGSSAPMRPGETISVRDLLYGLLLVSGNDSAVALANTVAGSVPRFVAMMNQEARAVGATRTHFANPDGLPNPDHVTTALDLARIAAAAIRNPTLVQVLGTKVLERYPMPSGPPQPMVNQDRLLWTFPGIVGGKIGFTDQAGNTMVAVARRHGMTLIAVVLHDVPWTYFGDVAGLLDYGFAHYHQVTLVPAGLALGRRPIAGVVGRSAPLETAGAVTWAVENGGQVAVTTHLAVPRRLPSGRPAGTPVGTLTVGVAGQGATSVPVVLARATPKPPPPARPWRLAWPDLALAAAAVAAAAAGAARRRAKSLRMHMHMRPRRRYRLRRDSVWMRLAGGSR